MVPTRPIFNSLTSLFLLSWFCFHNTCLLAEEPTIDFLKANVRSLPSGIQKADSLLRLSKLYYSVDYDSTVKYAEEAWNVSLSIRYEKGLDQSSAISGTVYMSRGAYDHAIETFYKLREAGESLASRRLISIANARLGIAHDGIGDYTRAIKYLIPALAFFQKTRDSLDIAKTSINIAVSYNNLFQYEEALHHLREAITYSQALGNDFIKVSALTNMGDTWEETGQLDSAEYAYLEGIRIFQDIKRPHNEAAVLLKLTEIYLQTDRLDAAEALLQKALVLSEKYQLNPYIGATKAKMADFSLSKGSPSEAILLAREALAIVEEEQSKRVAERSLQVLMKAYAQMGDYKQAFAYQKAYFEYKDSVYSEEKQDLVERLKIQFQTQQTERKLATQQKQIFQEKEKTQTLSFGLVFAAIVILFLGIAGYQYRENNRKLTKTNAFIEAQRKRLRELHDVKDRFFTIIAHDIRRPIANLEGLIDILIDEPRESPEHGEILKKMKKQAHETKVLFGNLVDWARKNWDNEDIEPVVFDLREIVAENMALVENHAVEKNIQLKYGNMTAGRVRADINMIDTVVRNLFDNALKFTPNHGIIEVSISRENKNATFCISDTGIGISAERMATIFDARHNKSTPGTKNELGSGIGLPLCKDLIEQNNGRIWVESTIGKGSKFCFSLPLI